MQLQKYPNLTAWLIFFLNSWSSKSLTIFYCDHKSVRTYHSSKTSSIWKNPRGVAITERNHCLWSLYQQCTWSYLSLVQVFAIRFNTGFWLELYCYEVVKHVMYWFNEKKLMSRSCFVLLVVIIVVSSLKVPVGTQVAWSNESQYCFPLYYYYFWNFFLLFS